MAKDFQIKATITAEDQASAVVSRVEKSFSTLEAGIQGAVIGAFAGLTQQLTSAVLPALTSFINAAQESEDAARALSNALADQGPAGARISQNLLEQAGALQKVTRFTDEAIASGQTFAAAFIKNEDTLKRVTVAAVDLATGLGIDLQTAFELLTKASQGHTETLARYGITLDDTIPKGEKLGAVLSLIGERFSGRAAADAKTYSGEIAKMGNAFGELEEAIGRVFTTSTAGVQTIRDLTVLLNGTADGANASAKSTTAFSQELERLQELALRSGGTLGNLVATYRSIQQARAEATAAAEAEAATERKLLQVRIDSKNQAAEIALAEELQARNISTLTASLGSEQAAWEALNDSKNRASRINAEIASDQDKLAAAAARLGVTLETNVNNAINENNVALQAFRQALQDGVISSGDFERAQAALAQANRDLLDSLNPVADRASQVATSFDSGAAAASRYAGSLVSTVVPALEAVGAAAQTAAQKITGANDSMLGPLDQPGDPLPSNLGRSRGGASAILTYGQAFSQQAGGIVRTTKIANTASGGNVARTYTVFGVLPNGKVYPLGTQVIGPDGTILSGQQFG